jgi:hypothetical protein
MTSLHDSLDEMRGPFLDPDTADRLLAGRVDPDDAPPGFAEVARVLRAAGAPARSDELVWEPWAVAVATRLIYQGPARSHVSSTGRSPVRSRMRSRFFRSRVAGLVVVGTLAGTTGLAAAGALPHGAQHAVSTVLSKMGISVPQATPQPTDVTHPASTGAEISQLARTTTATGVAKGAQISSLASSGISRAGQHPSGGAPPVTTPNTGGTGTADQASGGHADRGTATADAASQGHSSAGSGNAADHKP